jgi:hypothetical protein
MAWLLFDVPNQKKNGYEILWPSVMYIYIVMSTECSVHVNLT